MDKFLITGGKILAGDIRVSGAKNAVLPLMAACLLTTDECTITNVPNIDDVESMIQILRDLGARVERADRTLVIQAQVLVKSNADPALASALRASVLCLGPLLARTGEAAMPFPGGDKIGHRSISTHLDALQTLGALVEATEQTVNLKADKLVGAKIVLEESSVTATENAMLAAVLAKGTTIIKLAAMEPHVQQLGEFLKLMGADISGYGTTNIIINGVEKLRGASIAVIPDSEEAASLITLAAATKSHVRITNLNPDFLEDYFLKIKQMKVNFSVGADFVEVLPPTEEYQATKIQCGLYPKLNSDYLPPMAVLATQAQGETLMYEWMYEDRLGYIPELKKMGAASEVLDPHRVKISGPTPLHGQQITSYDLRMGITLIIAALVADGVTEISDIHHVDRGYEAIDERLRAIGADIKRTS